MIDLKIGEVYKAFSVSSGNSDYYGEWEQIILKENAEKKRKKNQGLMIPILVTNHPSGVVTGGSFRVKSIGGAQIMLKQRKNAAGTELRDQNNKYIKERVIKIYAEVEPVDAPVEPPVEDFFSEEVPDDIFGEVTMEEPEEKEEIPFWLR